METSRFFKIVIDPQDNKLRIPQEFISRYGHNLPDKVTLKTQNGPMIEVELVQYSNGETWLHKGWENFKELNSVGFANLLIFEYDGNSNFNVVIFDTSAVEIVYQHECMSEDVESESDNPAINFNDLLTNKKRKDAVKGKFKDLAKNDDRRFLKSKTSSKDCTRGNGRQFSKEDQLQYVDRKRCIAYQNASTFKSDNPTKNPFHIVVMQPSYISKNSNLNLPLRFAKEFFGDEKYNNLTLCSLDGKEWCVRCALLTRKVNISTGWKQFVMDNALRVGDACVFEVVKNAKLKLNVVIFRG